MKKFLCASAILGAFLISGASVTLVGCAQPQPVYVPPPPPIDFRAVEAQGDRDGFEAARHDVETNQPPVFDHHPRFRNPPVPPPAIEAYRRGFRIGYERFLHPPR